ncbi:MAG TPA: VOC family protein [Tepidiformaceae bacterium]|nr:VOC family protein [Tepidiformaceae bacterium]HNO66392.1 VOC family protein [Tepidiformaceae bacterium]
MAVKPTHIDHIVISSNDSSTVAQTFQDNLGIEIKRKMIRPGTSAQLAFAKLREVILEFAGPPEVKPGEEVKARLWGMVVAVDDIDASVADLREKGYVVGDPTKAVQPGAKIATVKGGTSGVPFAMIQYNALPIEEAP